MPKILSLKQLIDELQQATPQSYPSLLKGMRISEEDFKCFENWKSDGYTRNCIHRDANFELLLLCWNPREGTAIHNHDGQKCWVYQVSGSIEEVRYEKNQAGNLMETHSLSLPPTSLSYMDDAMGYHALINTSDEKAVTLHLYMNPIDQCDYFCDATAGFKRKKLTYDTSVNERFIQS